MNSDKFNLDKIMKSDKLWLIALFIIIMLRYPAATFLSNASGMGARAVLEFFIHSAVGMFALGTLLWNSQWFKVRPPLFPSILIGIIGVSSLLHAFVGGDELVFEGIMLVALPLIAFIQYRNMIKLFPWLVAIVWCIDAFHLFDWAIDYYNNPIAYGGCGGDFGLFIKNWMGEIDYAVSIAGNRNWQAAFIGGTTPFACWAGWRIVRYFWDDVALRLPINILVQILIIGVAIFMYVPLNSRASVVSLSVAGVIFALIFGLRWLHRTNIAQRYKTLGIAVIAVAVVGGGLGFFANDYIQSKFENFSANDVRVPMWRAATNLIFETHGPIRDNVYPPQDPSIRWATGIGSKYFEDEYMTYRGPDYFTRKVAANRTDFPHNHTFYVASYAGLPAAAAWIILALFPLTAAFFRLLRMRVFRWHWVLPFWCVIVLLTHAQLDLIMEYWPMAAFLLFSLGILWRLAWPAKTTTMRPFLQLVNDKAVPSLLGRVVLMVCGAYMIYGAFNLAFAQLTANRHQHTMLRLVEEYRYARTDRERWDCANKIDREIKASIAAYPKPDIIYNGITNATRLHPSISAKTMDFYMDQMFNVAKRYNYCDINITDAERLLSRIPDAAQIDALGDQYERLLAAAGTDTKRQADAETVGVRYRALLEKNKAALDDVEAAFLRQIQVYPVGYRGWYHLSQHYRRMGRTAEAEFCSAQLRKVMAIKGMIVPNVMATRPFNELLASQDCVASTENMIGPNPLLDLRPWALADYKREWTWAQSFTWVQPPTFPTLDMSTWPDMRFVYNRLGPNRTAKLDVDPKTDISLIDFEAEKEEVAKLAREEAEKRMAEIKANIEKARADSARVRDSAPVSVVTDSAD